MTLKEHATRIGKSPHFLHRMKHYCPEKYKYIEDKKGSLSDNYIKYIGEKEDLKNTLEEIYNELRDSRKINAFGIHLADKGLYSNRNGFGTSINKVLFSVTGEPLGNHTFFMKVHKIIEEYENFKKDNP